MIKMHQFTEFVTFFVFLNVIKNYDFLNNLLLVFLCEFQETIFWLNKTNPINMN